jgi:hypothetical protein
MLPFGRTVTLVPKATLPGGPAISVWPLAAHPALTVNAKSVAKTKENLIQTDFFGV